MFISLQQLLELTDNDEIKDAAKRIIVFIQTKEKQYKLTNIRGFIYKKELIEKVFNGSKHCYLDSIRNYMNYNQKFRDKYTRHRKARKIPIFLVRPFLKHIGEAARL